MQRRLFSGAAILAVSLLGAAAGQAQPQPVPPEVSVAQAGVARETSTTPTPRGLDGKPDLSGFWRPIRVPGKPGGNLGKDEPNFVLPFSEAGRRAHVYAQNHTVDPEAVCVLGGIPRHNGSGLAFEVLHTPGRLATLYNYNTHRFVTIDPNLKHPATLEPSYFGTGIAHWEGDVLVIETRGLRDSSKDKIWLDENGDPTSDETTVVERWSRPNYHTLQLSMTVTDLKYYTRPFKFDRTWTRAEPGQGLGEYACNESNSAVENIGPGAGVIGPDGNRGFGYERKELPSTPPGPEAYENVLTNE
ncbi:MAG: hypothetical protein DI570_18195 [Phenylobacterium zucineum]|nr:MAG: hypothetical protein DI570_18195 [Phenylobacterium zucineum]